VGPEGREEAGRRIAAAGAGPLSVGLAADAPGGELDRRLSHGVIIRVAGGAKAVRGAARLIPWKIGDGDQDSLERDRAIIEHAADAFFVYDAGGKIFDVNRRACGTLGYTREELLSLSMTDVEAILLPEGIAGLWRRLASGEPVTTEGANRRKDGTAFPVEIRVSLLGEVGRRRLALSIARDITGRKALEQRLFQGPSTIL
jgi:PAS domain S-box-containing protein